MKTIIKKFHFIVAIVLTFAQASAADREPEQVVQAYIAAFKDKNKEAMLSCLSEVFLVNFKSSYISKFNSYDNEMRKSALEIFGVATLDQLKELSGRVMLSAFLDSPSSATYWQSFDSVELIVEVERIEISVDHASVRSWLYTKKTLPAKVETIYSLAKTGNEWRIDRFQKKLIEP
ncbi:MAG TPA: hypothetical protein DCP71_12315 [Verrucomicrobiales bacterium]|nr:hypothetical protein [Verrucomicrobiales bacterium]